jgi:hypothetical protein
MAPRAHRLRAAAWSAFIAAAIGAVGVAWVVLWPLTLPLELLFKGFLSARVHALQQKKLHVPGALRVRVAPCAALAWARRWQRRRVLVFS